ncbi:MAG: hypothetical protein P1U39_08220 [Legionellaceae bacterium]|nr:hypothetical protein [Legionellaceae bacterium]
MNLQQFTDLTIFHLDALDKEQSSVISSITTENQRSRRMFTMFQELPFMSNPNEEMKDASVHLGV